MIVERQVMYGLFKKAPATLFDVLDDQGKSRATFSKREDAESADTMTDHELADFLADINGW